MSPGAALALLIVYVPAVVLAVRIGERKGRGVPGLLLGLLLGWLGVIIIALTSPTREKLVQRERERLEIQREARG
jgi:uncharacterized membrane protein